MGKKILVVVDYQYDFCNPNGALYVNGAEKLQDKIANIIPNFNHIIFTQDWHPYTHCSFFENGGEWPTHCVAGTIGAGIPLDLIKISKSFAQLTKGEEWNEEEYGAFSYEKDFATEIDYLFEYILEDDYSIYKNKVFDSVEEIVVCGVAGDYCVLETLKNIVSHIGNNKVKVYLEGVASIDDGSTLENYMKENNIQKY